MALMSSPDPMPVEVMAAVEAAAVEAAAVDTVGVEAVVAVVAAVDGAPEMVELMVGYARLSSSRPDAPTVRASAGNSLAGNSPTTAPVAGLICWINFPAGSRRN